MVPIIKGMKTHLVHLVNSVSLRLSLSLYLNLRSVARVQGLDQDVNVDDDKMLMMIR